MTISMLGREIGGQRSRPSTKEAEEVQGKVRARNSGLGEG
jgi:hypothetical protein